MNELRFFRFLGSLIGLVVLLVLVLTGNPARAQHEIAAPRPIDVGMIALIAAPEHYEGRFVRTHGFLCIEFEGDAVYLHEEDYRHGLTKNSFALRLTKPQRDQFKSLSLKYVLIEGTVFAKGLESADMWSGAIGNVTRLEVWPIDRGVAPHQ